MGEINCHCHMQPNNISTNLQPIGPNLVDKLKEQSHRKGRSRVNSIISPRQIIGVHSKTNSTANIAPNYSSDQSYLICDKGRKIVGQDIESNRLGKAITKYVVYFKYGSEKYEIVMGNQVVKIGAVMEMTGKYDVEVQAQKEDQVFGLCLRFNKISNTLSVKDNGLGLGVFQFLNQGEVREISLTEQINTPNIVLDIGVGRFVLIKRKSTNHKAGVSYSIISNKLQLQKIPRSLPSLFDVGEDCPHQNPRSKICPSVNKNLEEGDTEIIENAVELRITDHKIKIKCVSGFGLYRYLAEYQQLTHGMVLRCGVSIYDVAVNKDVDVDYRLTPR